ncbi:MAG: L-lactate permease [Clostridia bacterium]|nr:L-lactate permease [Clostridia bacterium]
MATILSLLPLISLLFCLLVLKYSASRAGALAVFVAMAGAILFFGMDLYGLSIAISKGLSLAIYVLLIIWSAIFLYHTVYEFGAIDVINKNIVLFIKNPFVQFLLLAWLFSSVLQGIAGFGVPVIIVVPILISLGFNPLVSVAAVLLGHSWSVSFGSMGSSFFTIFLVTGLDQQSIGYSMVIFDLFAMVMMSMVVAYIYGGFTSVKASLYYILPSSVVMVAVMTTVVYFNLVSLVGLLSALSGFITMYFLYRIKEKPEKPTKLYQSNLTLLDSLLPYIVIIILSLLFSVLNLGKYSLAFQFPEYTTALGYFVKAEEAYSKIKLFGHPAPIIVVAATLTLLRYKKIGVYSKEKFKSVVDKTISKSINTSITLFFLISMALVMMDSGMTATLANAVAAMTGNVYPLVAPFFGVLGSFITGSNTNSNVIFGKFQTTVAENLMVNPYIMAGLQSIAGSVGVSLGPTTVLMAASASGLTGQEASIYGKVLRPVLFTALILGIVNFLLLFVVRLNIGA